MPVRKVVDEAEELLAITMLGPPSVRWQGLSLSIPRRQVRALLYVLASHGTSAPRDVLCHLFWPNVATDIAHTNLSRLLYLLQRALPVPHLVSRDGERVGLNRQAIWTDLSVLSHVLSHPLPTYESLRAAAALYRGPFLEGFSLQRAPQFDLWLAQQRHEWERRYLALLTRLIDAEERLGRYEEAVRWARRYLSIDELAEHIHRRLILLYSALGDRERAVRQFEECVLILERELGIDPLPETRAAYEAARVGRTWADMAVHLTQWEVRPSLDVPFVGRETILEKIFHMYTRAREGRGAAIFISGEPGIGKTRLIREFVATLPPTGLVLSIRGSEGGQEAPYAALVEGLRELLPVLNWETLEVSPRVLAHITRILPELRERCPHLLSPANLPPGEDRQLLFHALSNFVAALAHRFPPLVLCLDDLHWVDSTTRAWLTQWITRLRYMPVVVLATYRPEYEAMLIPLQEMAARHGQFTMITLEGLGSRAVRQLLEHLWGKGISEETVQRLQQATGGNPFFLLEILRALVEEQSGAIEGLDRIPLPATVKDAVRQRLARLSPQERHVLAAAAVLGPRFTLDVLVETSGYSEEDVALALEMLVSRGVLEEEPPAYCFTHQIVRELIYDEITFSRRELLHRRAAQVLERIGEDPAIVARHLHLGARPQEAAKKWIEAGDKARLVYAYDEAIRCYERALALQRELQADACVSRTLMRLGLTHHLAFRFAQSAEAYRQGFDLWQRTRPLGSTRPPAPRPFRIDWPNLITLDPALIEDPNSGGVIEQLFSGLAEWDPEMNVVPDLARGWDVLADGRQYVFYLREDAIWNDGHPVVAQDFVVAWQRVLHPKGRTPNARLLYPLRNARAVHRGDLPDTHALGVRALDDLTLVVELEHPCSFFLHLMAHPIARPVPSHLIEQEGDRWWHPGTIVSNGPFTLVHWDDEGERSVYLQRSPTYRGRWPGNVDAVRLYLGLDRESKERKWHLYLENQLDLLILRWGLPADFWERVRREYAAELISVPNFFVRFLGFNMRLPPFDDVRVRRAFAQAIDRRVLASLLGGDLRPAYGGMIPPGMPGHTKEGTPPYDPLAAQATLAAAGYRKGQGFPEVTMLVFPAARLVAEYVQQAWERVLRVSVRLEYVPWHEYVERLNKGALPHLFMAGWVADYPDPDNFLRVNAFHEWTGWQHDEYFTLLERAIHSRDQNERTRLYQQADAILIQELPVVPLFYSHWTFLRKAWVRVFPVSPLKWWFWKDVVLG